MSWNYRHNNSWQTPTVKQRKNGQWITISSGDSNRGSEGREVPSRFYTDGPPERSGATITYDGDSHSSLQAAVESLSSGDTLYIDPANDPYVERLDLSAGNISDSISIVSDGELSFDSNGAPTIEQHGAIIRRPDENRLYAIGSQNSQDPSISSDTSIAGSHGLGDEVLSVNDASSFSVGDIIWIEEDRVPYGEGSASGGSYHPSTTTELREVTGISGNDLTLNYQLLLPFPNNNSTSVGRMNWHLTDLHLSGLQVEGNQSFSDRGRPLYVRSINQLWADNMVVSDSTFHGIQLGRCFRPRFDKTYVYDCPNRYALNGVHMTTHTYITDIAADNINRYAIRIAHTGGGRGSTDAVVDGVYGANFTGTNAVVNSHFGGFHMDWRNIYSDDGSYLSRMRSRYLTLENSEKSGSGGPTFVFAQRPHGCTVRNVTVRSRSGKGYAFKWRMRDSANSPRDGAEDERFDNILIEEVDIGQIGSVPITDIGYFEIEGDPEPSGSLTFRNVTYDGQQLTESDVTSWNGWDSDYITNLTVE